MHNQEEELTITGKVLGGEDVDPYNENAILAELQLPPKIDHLVFSQETQLESLEEFVFARAIVSIRKKLASTEGKKEVIANETNLINFVLKVMSDCKSSSELKDYVTILDILIVNGCTQRVIIEETLKHMENIKDVDVLEQCFQIVRKLESVGCNSCEALEAAIKNASITSDKKRTLEWSIIINQLIENGSKSDKSLELAVNLIYKLNDPDVNREYLNIVKRLICIGCKSNQALEKVLLCSNRANNTEKFGWFSIALQLINSGCRSDDALKTIIEIIKSCDNIILKKVISKMAKDIVDERLNLFLKELEDELCDNIQKLIGVEYSSIVLDLFLSGQNKTLLNHRKTLVKDLNIVHEFTDDMFSNQMIKSFLLQKYKEKNIVDNVLMVNSLIETTVYITISGIYFVKCVPDETRCIFNKMEEVCYNITSSAERKNKIPSEQVKMNFLKDLCLVSLMA